MRLGMLLTTGGPVNFPGLDISIEHLMEGFDVFGIHISLSGILLVVAMFLGLFITERLAKKTEQDTENYLDLAIHLVIAGVIGARIGYIVTHWQYFASDQANVLDISDGGMSFAGALIAGLMVSFVYCRKKKLSWLQVCDTALPGVVFAQMIGTVGAFFDRSALGTYSGGRFAMQVDIRDVDANLMKLGQSTRAMTRGNFLQVHPLALYEIVLLLVLLVFLAVLFKVGKLKGLVLSIYLIGYGAIRFGLEFIRMDSIRMIGNRISLEHLVAIGLCLYGATILTDQLKKDRIAKKERPKNLSFVKKSK